MAWPNAFGWKCCGTGGGPAGGANIPNCDCQGIPETLTMTSADESCNFHMFQSCTLQWMPAPAWIVPLNLGDNLFLSTESFPDPIAGDSLFYYYFTCRFSEFTISRIYPPPSAYSADTPYRDGNLYSWLVGGDGNTCDPFHMDGGTAFLGSDPTCDVDIDA